MNGKSFYTIYKCKVCRREMILETEEVVKMIQNKHYLVCPYCKHRDLKEIGKYDSLIQCYINKEDYFK